jgi:hypothetical protein
LIRQWANYFLKHGDFPDRRHGKHQKVLPLIFDEDIRLNVLSYLRSLNKKEKSQLTSFSLANWINNISIANKNYQAEEPTQHDELNENANCLIHISPSTAQRWMNHLGFHFGEVKKGIYVDGHERSEVVNYRQNLFIPKMLEYRKRMTIFSSSSDLTIAPRLTDNEKEIVWVVQDECVFASNDARKCVWMEDGKPPIRPKGDGKVIMVSEFLCPCHGRMKWEGKETTEIITPGANNDGYWDNKDVVKQLTEKVIPIFNKLHPNKMALFAFDNSTNHQAKAEDALIINRLKLSDGFPSRKLKGEDKTRTQILRDGWYYNEAGERMIQVMVNEQGVQKGIKKILEERGLWLDSMTLQEGKLLLSQQMDFRVSSYSSLLKETIESAGHLFIFFPKFHPEFNPIELYWGKAKQFARSNCNYSFEMLKNIVPNALDCVDLITIRKFFNHCWRYFRAYKDGTLSPSQVEWAIKKYSSHRRIQDTTTSEIDFLTPEFCEDMPSS